VTVLAAAPAADTVVTGVLGFLVVAGMGLALFFLLRSMNKQLRKVAPDPRWREKGRDGRSGATAGSGSGREHQAISEKDRPGPG
jgi:hypothetical protein